MVAVMNPTLIERPEDVSTEMRNVIVVDGLPIAPLAKFEKLVKLVRSKFVPFGPITEDGFYLPYDEQTEMTVGYAFIEYEDEESAAAAVSTLDRSPIDKKHTFRVCIWSEFDRLESLNLEYVPPVKSDFQMSDDLQSYLQDPNVRDQIALRFGEETQIVWHDPLMNDGLSPCYAGEKQKLAGRNWTELCTQWSPSGTYLATFHNQGIMLWGGDQWENLARFGHGDVIQIEFSPCEKFIVTYSGIEAKVKGDPEALQVHDVRSGKKLRGFSGLTSFTGSESSPMFKWSFDDKYFARLGDNEIFVYNSSTMLLEGKALQCRGAQEFQWSPSQHIIAYWAPELDNIPASVSLVSIPDGRAIREKHLFNVHSVSLHWQNLGEFLCVKVARIKSKAKADKISSTNFEIFRLMDKDIPVEVVELKEGIACFAWEPRGTRFAVAHGDGMANKYAVSFYSLKKSKIKLDATIPPRVLNAFYWSPMGNYIIFAGLDALNGTLEFFDVNRKLSLASNEHFKCTEVHWSPSGVYVATACTQPLMSGQSWRYSNENGYKIWTFQGQIKHEQQTEQFYQFLWRPRPASLLSKEQQSDIFRTIRETYYKKFDDEDDAIRQSQLSVEARSRADAKKSFREYRAQAEADRRANAAKRAELRGGFESDNDDEYEITIVEIEEEDLEARETHILP